MPSHHHLQVCKQDLSFSLETIAFDCAGALHRGMGSQLQVMHLTLQLESYQPMFGVRLIVRMHAWSRPAYLQLSQLRDDFPTVPIACFTATATREVQKSISETLQLKNPVMLQGSFNRPNIHYQARCKETIGDGTSTATLQVLFPTFQGPAKLCPCRLHAACAADDSIRYHQPDSRFQQSCAMGTDVIPTVMQQYCPFKLPVQIARSNCPFKLPVQIAHLRIVASSVHIFIGLI